MLRISEKIQQSTFLKGVHQNSLRTFSALVVFSACVFSMVLTTSCKTDPHVSNWSDEEVFTITQYLNKNKEEYSKSFLLLDQARMLSPLSGYNPYGDGYSLFLPTNEAIDKFILESPNYSSFEELLKDVAFINPLARYHTVKRRVHTDEFPDGALADSTLTGERLVFGFYSEGENLVIKVNNKIPIVKSNITLTNGYIHVISEVLQPVEITGYEWLQEQEEYSILAEAMELAGISRGLWWKKYTIMAEHDSVYHRHGIFTAQDLISRLSDGTSLGNPANPFYQFTAFHMVGGEYYLNELDWGSKNYTTRAGNKQLHINVGVEIKINPGVDVYGTKISDSGDTLLIDYVRINWESSNNATRTGPIHSLTDLLYFEPFPEKK